MLRSLRAVGESVAAPARGDAPDAWPLPAHFERYWYASGTAALAATLRAIIEEAGKTQPTVLVPAYTCPDVLSAIEFAGATAVAVDFEAERPWLSIDEVMQRTDARVVGVIAINFQGIPEQLARLRAFADQADIPLVYDHCQGFPLSDALMALSDCAVFSFGRGKPAAALTGGAVIVNRERQPQVTLVAPQVFVSAPPALKRHAYNLLIRPGVYGWPAKLPFLAIGQTVYHRLETLAALDERGVAAVTTAIRQYPQNDQAPMLHAYREWLPKAWDLALQCGEHGQLLRLPVLLPDADTKRRMLRVLSAKGLGASPLYPTVLCELPGVPAGLIQDAGSPVARDFAARLLTLPLHTDVTRRDIDAMRAVLSG
ncbi:MAG: DegT/DnrJ/EryC1/StrS family aminotransferase [Pseudomonadota bacterium]